MTAPTPATIAARDARTVDALLSLHDDALGSLPDHREAWDYLLARAREEEERRAAEPHGGRLPPWERPKRESEKPKSFIVARFVAREPAAEWEEPTQIAEYHEYDGETDTEWSCTFDGAADGERRADVERWAAHVATWRRRGRPVVLLSGGSGLNLLLLDFAASLTPMGHRLRVVAARDGVCGLSLQKGHHAWQFWSLERVTGCERDEWERHAGITGGAALPAGDTPWGGRLRAVFAWLSEVQAWLVAHFGVALHATVAGLALGGAARRLPPGWQFWRPPSLLDTLCRTGGAYRGGWVYARRYQARPGVSRPLVSVDVRRLYAWCLTRPLPLDAGLALAAEPDGTRREGLWLCTIHRDQTAYASVAGSALPVSLAVWSGAAQGFTKQLWRGKSCVALLSSGEMPGLESLGYIVQPGIGYWYTQTFDLRSYVAAFQAVIDQHGANSWQSGLTKWMANCLSGKWGARQHVLDVCYSETVPHSSQAENARGEYWYPMLDTWGVEVPGCWERRRRWIAPTQQPQLATAVTAHGRGKTYEAAARLEAAGGRVYYVDTDGILTTSDPEAAGLDLTGDTQIGAWRMGEWDDTGQVAGVRAYASGGDVVLAGSNAPAQERRAAVALLVDGRSAEMAVRVVRRPWSTQEGGVQRRTFTPLRE